MSSVLNKTSNVFVDSDGSNGASVFYLPLDQLFKQRAAHANAHHSASIDDSTSKLPDTTALASNQNAKEFSHPRYPFMSEGGQS